MAVNGRIIWIFGRPSSGKSTLAVYLSGALHMDDIKTEILDGDSVRKWLTPDCDFSPEGREKNIRRALSVAEILRRNDVIAICAFVTPTRYLQNIVKQNSADMVFVDTPLSVCIDRDSHGLYWSGTPDIDSFEIPDCQREILPVIGLDYPGVSVAAIRKRYFL